MKDVSYPNKADGNGHARRYHNRKAYYFGRFDSADSYVLFGLWKKVLLKTGEPPEMTSLREKMEDVLDPNRANEELRDSNAKLQELVTELQKEVEDLRGVEISNRELHRSNHSLQQTVDLL